ncbi:MAG: hypothetical protein DIU52_014930 [bacterium]|jgi:opacity protein-like surface antigen|nr:MAG: hypothetical protein DIU52_10575 [bacterium]
MRKRLAGLVLALTVWSASGAAAQVAWDSPMLLPPRPANGFGLYLMEAAFGDLGVMATWRGTRSFGLRFGLAEQDFDNDLAVFGGVDFSGTLARASADFPLDASWVVGVGLSAENNVLLSFPFGVTLGRTLPAEGATFTPYGTPRLMVDACLGDDDDFPGRRGCFGNDDLDLDFAIDLGVDVALRQGWTIRFGITLGGDRDALAIGILF